MCSEYTRLFFMPNRGQRHVTRTLENEISPIIGL